MYVITYVYIYIYVKNKDLKDSKCFTVITLSICDQSLPETQLSKPRGWCGCEA